MTLARKLYTIVDPGYCPARESPRVVTSCYNLAKWPEGAALVTRHAHNCNHLNRVPANIVILRMHNVAICRSQSSERIGGMWELILAKGWLHSFA